MTLSLRVKVLLLLALVLAAAVIAHLVLATNLFTRDKLAYIFDLNASLANTLAEESRSGLEGLADKVRYFATEPTATEPGAAQRDGGAIQRLMRSEPDLLQLSFDSEKERLRTVVDDARLGASDVTRADLVEAEQRVPLDFAAVQQLERVLTNISLAPDLALWRLSLRAPDGSVVSALFKPNRFLRMFGNAEAYSAYMIDARGGVLLHPDSKKVVERTNLRAISIVRDALESKTPRGAEVFAGEDGRRYIGAYAQVAPFGLAVITLTPESEAQRASAALIKRTTLFAIGIFFVALLISILVSRRISSPLQRLTKAMSDVGRGNFSVNVPIESSDEVGVLASAFNRMAQELDDRDRRIEAAREELQRAEKMATLGVLGAEISHEIKNPLTAIVGFAQLASSSDNADELRDFMRSIEAQTIRARELLENFLSFTRQERASHEPVDLNDVVTDSLKLVRHQLAKHRIEVQINLWPTRAVVLANANQLQQVLLNLILNADQAMNGPGTLAISTRIDGDRVALSVRDTGPGMSEEVQKQLFKPFFTTKPKGVGTGLGLSVSHSIVQQHAGEWIVDSHVGAGTTFTVWLPAEATGRSEKSFSQEGGKTGS